MAQSAMIGTSSLMVKKTSIPRTISPFTAFRGHSDCFSGCPSACSKRNRRCLISTSTQTSLLSMEQLYRVVSGQVYLGTQTHQKLKLPFQIYLGSLKFAGDSLQEFVPYRTSCIQADCILPTMSTFREQVI